MASSGWQTEQTLTSWGSYGAHLAGNVRIDSIVHTGTTVTISGAVRCALRTNSNVASTWSDAVTGYVTGGSTVSFGGSFSGTKSSPDVRDRSFSATLTTTAAATSISLSVRFAGGNLNTTKSWTLTMDSGGTAPATPTVSVVSIADTSAVLHVAVSNYGDPASATGRYLEAAILGSNSYGAPYRAKKAANVSSADITVGNSSSDSGSLTIVPNTRYYFGGYANNTVLNANTVGGQILMLPAYITNVVANDDGTGNITVSVIHGTEGSDDTAYTEYSYDQTTWNAVQDEFHITVHSATTIYIRRENSTGVTPVYPLSIVPTTTVKLYGSVNGQAKEVKTLYGSVGGESKKIVKLYGSVNGRAKLIYEDLS